MGAADQVPDTDTVAINSTPSALSRSCGVHRFENIILPGCTGFFAFAEFSQKDACMLFVTRNAGWVAGMISISTLHCAE